MREHEPPAARPPAVPAPDGPPAPRLYAELAAWWPLMSAPEEYAEEAAFFGDLLARAGDPALGPPRTVLELGSGGGNVASHLKARYALTLVDRAPGMLAVSRALNPECAHAEGDLRTVRLGRTFDAVFVHDAVCYVTTEADLARAFATAFAHCRPGGGAVFAPDYVRETFRPSTDSGGNDAPEGRGLRYLEWVWDPDPADATYVADYAYLIREADGATRVVHDRHVEGVFPRATWLALLAEAGFEARAVRVIHGDLEPGAVHEAFVARRPGSAVEP